MSVRAGAGLGPDLFVLVKNLIAGASLAVLFTEIKESLVPGKGHPYVTSSGLIEEAVRRLHLRHLLGGVDISLILIGLFLLILLAIYASASLDLRANRAARDLIVAELEPAAPSPVEPTKPDHDEMLQIGGWNALGIGLLFAFGAPFAPLFAAVGAVGAGIAALEIADQNAEYDKGVARASGARQTQAEMLANYRGNALAMNRRHRQALRLSLISKFVFMFVLVAANYLIPIWYPALGHLRL